MTGLQIISNDIMLYLLVMQNFKKIQCMNMSIHSVMKDRGLYMFIYDLDVD